jgi:tight adherence protein B
VWRAVRDRADEPAVRALASAVVAGARRGEPVAVALRGHLAAAELHARRRRLLPGAPAADAAALRQLVVALDVSERTGSAAGPTLNRLAEGLREAEAAAGERESALAGPRASATVLGVLPLAGLAMGGLLGADPLHVLVGTGPGRVSLVLGCGLWAVGRLWSRALVRRAAAG